MIISSNASFNFDRFSQLNSGGTVTVTPQTFTPGAAPVAGYEGRTFVQMVTASQSAAGDYAILSQSIEDVRTYAGQTMTVSFWAKAASGTPKIALVFEQNFGTGGSPSSAVVSSAGTVTLSTSWARYSLTFAMPSLSGKTVGTTANTSYLQLQLWISGGATYGQAQGIGNQNNTFQIWGVQAEAGSAATAFQTATGTLQGELAACQRYYYRAIASNNYSIFTIGAATNAVSFAANVAFPVTMRISPSAVDASAGSTFFLQQGATGSTFTATAAPTINSGVSSTDNGGVTLSVASGLTGNDFYNLLANNTTSAFIGFSAEL